MKNVFLTRFLILLSLLLILGCSNSRQLAKTEEAVNVCLPVHKVESYEGIDSDFFEVQEVFVNDNCLNVILTYEGGCGEVSYQVFYNDIAEESYPTQVFLKLKFTDNDPCRAIETDTISIDLSWFESMARSGGLQIGLAGNPQQVTYALPLR
ncbi:MAG: hypothetical protein RBR87_05030 [Bacteroidales bacterium]|jgi:hypothetical protein|nr:hypothetical protein [Bacteroidales bacterium]